MNQDTIEFLIEVPEEKETIRTVSKYMQERFEKLAEKNTEGMLSDSERVEYEKLVDTLSNLMVDNAKVRM